MAWGQMFGISEGSKHPRDQAVYISLVFFIRKVHSLLMYILITIRSCIYPEESPDYQDLTTGSILEYLSENVVLTSPNPTLKKSTFAGNFLPECVPTTKTTSQILKTNSVNHSLRSE